MGNSPEATPMVRVLRGRQLVETVSVTVPLDPWLSLQAAAGYSCLSVRNLRGWLSHPERPLPCYRVGGKILLRRSELDRWLETFRRVGVWDLDGTVNEILREFSEPNQELGGHDPATARQMRNRRQARVRPVAGESQNGAE